MPLPWFSRRATILYRHSRLESWRHTMNRQVDDLDQALRDLKDALAQAVDRIDAKLAALGDAHPDLTTEIEDIRADTATIAGLAADPAPTPAPAPAPTDTGTPPAEPPPTTDTPPAGG
jgi:hypothetical protein